MKFRAPTAAVVLASALALTGCGSDSRAETASPQEEVTEITVGALPVADYAPLFYAKENGLFEAEGLDVTVQPIQGGANAIPALLNGSFSIASTNWISYITALGQGIPVRAVLPAAQAAPGFSGIVALPKSGITEPADLEGKTVAINNLKSISELSSRISLEENGVDPATVKFTELPLPDMPAALGRGTVDAAWVVEPFLGLARKEGAKVVIDPFAGELDGLPVGGWSTSQEFAEANPGTLDKFSRAMVEASAALEDDATFREFLPTFTGLPPEAAAKLTLPTKETDLGAEDLNDLAAQMAEYDFVDEGVDVESSLTHLHETQ